MTMLRHECAAMRDDAGEGVYVDLFASTRSSEDGAPRWVLRLFDDAMDESVAAYVTYCPWCGARLDGQREEGC